MSGAAMAWAIVVAGALLGAWLALLTLRRWPRLRWLAAGLVVAWAVTPYGFDDEHHAPALAVALFRLLFESDAQWRVPLALAAASTLGVMAVHLAAIGAVALVDRRRGRHGALRM